MPQHHQSADCASLRRVEVNCIEFKLVKQRPDSSRQNQQCGLVRRREDRVVKYHARRKASLSFVAGGALRTRDIQNVRDDSRLHLLACEILDEGEDSAGE